MSVVEPDEVQAAEAGIELPTEEMKTKQALLEAGQPVESGIDTIQVTPDPKESICPIDVVEERGGVK